MNVSIVEPTDDTRQLQPVAEATGDLVALAIKQDLDIDKLRALIEMRNAQEEREAKRAFDERFAAMQADFETVHRTKEGHGYKYAPLEVLQKSYGPVIARHGFSYRWREESIPDGGKRTVMVISGHGHSEENYFDAPRFEGNRAMNPVQAAGAMSTYGRRYTFLSGFGVIVSDEDTDAHMSPEDTSALTDALDEIRTAENAEDLKRLFFAAYEKFKDPMARKLISEAKDARKKGLIGD